MAQTAKQEAPKGAVTTTSGSANVPAHLRERIKEDAGKGVSADAADNLVPLVYVLQGQSPQTMKPKPEYIKNAEPGDIWLRNCPGPTPIIKPEVGVLVQPCFFYKKIVEWIPRNPDGSGGGYVAEHEWTPDWQKRLNLLEVKDESDGSTRWMDQNEEHEFIETRNHAVIVYLETGEALPYLIPLSSSGHSVSRQWMFMMNSKTVDNAKVPSFACLYRLKTIMRTKGKNNWYVLDPQEGSDQGTLWATEEQYAAGKALHEAFSTGAKKADRPDDLGGAAKADGPTPI